ncbi:hypothetical protein CHGG_09584 [Chaetomium globosum CBS 148.51]|uniref:Ketoreductase (KR) domain-containing protein n=1 Tax=Chaetomium globosum (strain ATCC 6205 / CBS 148.51 / DSM 1962 / NBRC 6347 / NRRL 1970) TaxID=306901 RepID=Q2GR20_CHAGB|nr:uncharacterized protein CHGG_09584 [Chaetomium globosum CBS 148.51]EAQ83180.1 hypothetical protein CHGG_09584 [Chaetomium globosum CBS 148.51]
MGIIKKVTLTTLGLGTGVLGYLGASTSIVSPIPEDDPLWRSKSYTKYNSHRNPSTQDVCIKRIPLTKIKPELLEREGDLALEFCRGVWAGLGYRFQRAYLARKYHGPATASQLWTVNQLARSAYEPGTQLTDHFEVVEKTPSEVVVRCGDSPRNPNPRDSDGLFSIGAAVDRERGEAVLKLTSCLFISNNKVEGIQGPMPGWMEMLHRWYARLWMETGSWRKQGLNSQASGVLCGRTQQNSGIPENTSTQCDTDSLNCQCLPQPTAQVSFLTSPILNMPSISGHNLLIIGGSAGIGAAVAKLAAADGVNVAIASSNPDRIEKTIKAIKDALPMKAINISGFVCDVSHNDAEDRLEKLLTDVTAALGDKPIKGLAILAGWATALTGFARSLAVEIAPIRVNLVSPGSTDTDHHGPPEVRIPKMAAVAKASLLGKVGTAEDVAEAYIYLMKDSNCTGSTVSTEGGSLLQ